MTHSIKFVRNILILSLLTAATHGVSACAAKIDDADQPLTEKRADEPDGPADYGGANAYAPSEPQAGAPDETYCDRICGMRTGDVCWGPDKCKSYCQADRNDWTDVAADAFQHCVETDPLCFQPIDSCIWGELYPEPIDQTIMLSGDGFGQYESHVATFLLEDRDGPSMVKQATIKSGAFSIRFDINRHVMQRSNVLFYIDVNANGQCDKEGDLTGIETVPVSGDWNAPEFKLHIQPGDPAPFVCKDL